MALHLTIENEASLPDGGPLSVSVTGKRGIDIGRDQYLDWALPDPTRTISGKHCEVRYRDGGYWLHDVSRNGTFLNRSSQRMQEPYRLRDGDRIEIGRYIIAVRLDGEDESGSFGASTVSAPVAPEEYWNAAGEVAPPISARDLRPVREQRPVQADFSEWAVEVPSSDGGFGGGSFAPPAPSPATPLRDPFEDMSWAKAPAPPPVAPEPLTPMPTPRRPVQPGETSGGDPWGGAPAATAPAPTEDAASWAMPPVPPPPEVVPARPIEPAPPPPRPPAPPQEPAVATSPAAPTAESPWGTPSLAPTPRAVETPPQPSAAPADPLPVAPTGAAAPRPTPAPADGSDLLRRFAKGAGIPVEVLAWRDPGDAAEELGALVRLAAENLKQLLVARAEARRVSRTGGQTMIQALDNNPLKFSPTIDDALRIMLGRPTGGYLDARRAMDEGFRDLKTHQVKTYSAMQNALRLMMQDLEPAAIAQASGGDHGLGSLLGSKKAKLWDVYAARWDSLTAAHDDGIVDAFMTFFSECYDKGGAR